MLRMMRSRARKMMRLKMMLRRRRGRKTHPKVGTQTFVRAFAVEMHIDVAEESLCARNYRKMPGPRSATHTCAVDMHWTFHKSHFMREFTGKNAGAQKRDADSVRACAGNAFGHFTRAILRENLQEKCRGPEARRRLCASLRRSAFTLTVRTPQCGHTVWGMPKGDVPLRKALTKSRGYISLYKSHESH